jgi:prepilin-type N-terminal cleavage/methylation domain-containing protein
MKSSKGFTIVEMLTVMGIIVILISLLLPALGQVRDYSRVIQQKAQFHGIEVGLSLFESDMGYLPPSFDNINAKTGDNAIRSCEGSTTEDANHYTGANKLAEAMVGMDQLGFHPNSGFWGDGENCVKLDTGNKQLTEVYSADADTGNWQTKEENLDARKGPYLDTENANAYRMDEVYDSLINFNGEEMVLCDIYSKTRSASGLKTGMPLLYFKARTQYSRQDYREDENTLDTIDMEDDDIYYALDNYAVIEEGVPGTNGDDHPYITDSTVNYGFDKFEDLILNNKVSTIQRPYRANSYILWSAGKDGLYGTADDLTNFDAEAE